MRSMESAIKSAYNVVERLNRRIGQREAKSGHMDTFLREEVAIIRALLHHGAGLWEDELPPRAPDLGLPLPVWVATRNAVKKATKTCV